MRHIALMIILCSLAMGCGRYGKIYTEAPEEKMYYESEHLNTTSKPVDTSLQQEEKQVSTTEQATQKSQNKK